MNHSDQKTLEIAIVGGGFAGSILSRVLQGQGHQVTLLERAVHPRLALGESSTPLAAISLERLSARWDLPDLHSLATYARWSEHLPNLRRGLKRGFTFVEHTQHGSPSNRLLVAASPADRCADAHWMRSDLDHFLLERARAEGVRVLEGIELERPTLPTSKSSWRWRGLLDGEKHSGRADLIIDGSGAAGWLANWAAPATPEPSDLSTFLVAAHFSGVDPLPTGPRDPYPAGWAAVHHLIHCGWIYELRFDNGLTSAGLIVDRARLPMQVASPGKVLTAEQAERLWNATLKDYPALRRRFRGARRESHWILSDRLQRQAAAAAGPSWALLPSTYSFWSPLFSTGQAWSLLAVERLAEILDPDRGGNLGQDLSRYDQLLASESGHLRRLTELAYQAMPRFEAFHGVALIYFAAASYSEVQQRLKVRAPDSSGWCWSPFLGTSDPTIQGALGAIEAWLASPTSSPSDWLASVRAKLAPRDLVGLDTPVALCLYPADPKVLASRLGRLNLTSEEQTQVQERLRC